MLRLVVCVPHLWSSRMATKGAEPDQWHPVHASRAIKRHRTVPAPSGAALVRGPSEAQLEWLLSGGRHCQLVIVTPAAA